MNQAVATRQKTKISMTLAVAFAVIGISAAGFAVASFLSSNKATNSLSLATPANSSAQTTAPVTQGALVQLEPDDTATFSRVGGGKYTVKLLGTVAVEQTTICLQAFPNRAHVLYKEFDEKGTELDSQDLSIGPCDSGWPVDVEKASAPFTGRAIVTVPG